MGFLDTITDCPDQHTWEDCRHWLDISELFEQVAPAYGGDWVGAINYLTTNPTDASVINNISDVLSAGGDIDNPITLYFDAPDEDDEEDYEPMWRIANGMHRSVAYKLQARTRIPVRITSVSNEDDGDEDLVCLKFLMDVTAEDLAGDKDYVDESDFIFDNVPRSFPLDNGSWAEADFISGCNGVYDIIFYRPAVEADMVLDHFLRRAKSLGLTMVAEVADDPLSEKTV